MSSKTTMNRGIAGKTRGLMIGLLVVVLVVGLYLTLPSQWLVSSETRTAEKERPISLVTNDNNGGKRCEANQIYVAERTRDIHEQEGYAFIVNDYCSDLQRRLVDSIGNEDLVEVRNLISLGANPDADDWSKLEAVQPLMVSASGNADVVKALLDNGAVVNEEYCCCASCDSPLTRAMKGGQAETVAVLLDHGADINYKPSWGDVEPVSAFDQALQTGDPKIVQLAETACERTLSCRVRSRAEKILRAAGIR